MLHLFVRTSRPYLDGLGMWMEEGKLPVGSESWFMVARNQNLPSSNSYESSSPSSLPAPVAWGEGYVLVPNHIPSMAITYLFAIKLY